MATSQLNLITLGWGRGHQNLFPMDVIWNPRPTWVGFLFEKQSGKEFWQWIS